MTTPAQLQSLEEAIWSLKLLQTPAVLLWLIKMPLAANWGVTIGHTPKQIREGTKLVFLGNLLGPHHRWNKAQWKKEKWKRCGKYSMWTKRVVLMHEVIYVHFFHKYKHLSPISSSISSMSKTFPFRFTPIWHQLSSGHISSRPTRTIIRPQLAIRLHLMQMDRLENQHVNGH